MFMDSWGLVLHPDDCKGAAQKLGTNYLVKMESPVLIIVRSHTSAAARRL